MLILVLDWRQSFSLEINTERIVAVTIGKMATSIRCSLAVRRPIIKYPGGDYLNENTEVPDYD